MQEFQIVTRTQGNNTVKNYQIYDILFAPTPSDCKRVWDQMLERHYCTEEDYLNAQVSEGVFKYPWSKTTKKNSLILISDDVFTELEITTFNSADVDLEGNLIKRRKYRIDFNEVQYESISSGMSLLSETTLDSINDVRIVVEPRYDKPISKSFVKLK